MNGAKPAPPSRYHAVSVANPAMRASISRRDVLPFSLPPRGLSRVVAAAYVGVGVTLFDRMVADGLMPKPKKIARRLVWCRFKLDEAFAALPDEDGEGDDIWSRA
jgi:predicted DNA-binding transcriptional regulator AlpA